MTLYERIRQLRIAADMSQDDLARAVGYKDRSMITKIEAGRVDLSQKKILAFANVLHTTPAFLMGLSDHKPSAVSVSLTDEERQLIEAYRAADDRARDDALKTLLAHPVKKEKSSAI